MASCGDAVLAPALLAVFSISSSAAPAQKPFDFPLVMTRPLIDASLATFSAACVSSAIAELVSTFIVRPGTSQVRVTMPSASWSHLKLVRFILFSYVGARAPRPHWLSD